MKRTERVIRFIIILISLLIISTALPILTTIDFIMYITNTGRVDIINIIEIPYRLWNSK